LKGKKCNFWKTEFYWFLLTCSMWVHIIYFLLSVTINSSFISVLTVGWPVKKKTKTTEMSYARVNLITIFSLCVNYPSWFYVVYTFFLLMMLLSRAYYTNALECSVNMHGRMSYQPNMWRRKKVTWAKKERSVGEWKIKLILARRSCVCIATLLISYIEHIQP
jgi:hypothetical protein